MNFIADLPFYGPFNSIFTCIDKLTKWFKFVLVFLGEGQLAVSSVAHLFFEKMVCSFGVPTVVLHDQDPWFTS